MPHTPLDLAALLALGLPFLGKKPKEPSSTSPLRTDPLSAFLQAAETIQSGQLSAGLSDCLRLAVHQLKASAGYILTVTDTGHLKAEAAYSTSGAFPFPAKLASGTGISGQAALTGETIRVTEPGSGDAGADEFDETTKAVVSVPILSPKDDSLGSGLRDVLGVLTLVHHKNPKAFPGSDLPTLTGLAAIVGLVLTNLQLREFYRTNLVSTLERLSTALENKGGFMEGHSVRVSEISLKIAAQMGLEARALEELRIGTILHDIGKIAVPDSILNKAGALTDAEFDVMKSHTTVGYEICETLGLPEGVLLLVRNHHERLDGKGYPDGLEGHQLPLALRIVCVADVFDAMASSRPHRPGMAPEAVLRELNKHAETQFDPLVVEALRDLHEAGEIQPLYANTGTGFHLRLEEAA